MKDKVVIITGASSGIGRALAYEYASRKAKVVIAARRIDILEEIVADLKKNGSDVIAVETDVSKEEDCKKLIDKTVEEFDRIDILINNAGISMRALFVDLSIDVLKKLMDVNFWGTVYCTKYAISHLLKSKGSLVGVSSISGFTPLPARTGYCASKYAVNGFLNTLRIENSRKGLHVLIVAPWFTTSNIRKTALLADGSQQGETPRKEKKMMKAETVAKYIAKAVVKRKRTLILTLSGKISIFLIKVYPQIIERIMYNQMRKEHDSPLK